MATNQKVLNMAAFLQEDLKRRLAGLSTAITVADVTYDSDQNPLIRCGTGSIGAAGGLVKVMPRDWPLSLNSIGQAAPNYGSQTVIQYCREASVSANTMELEATIHSALSQRGTRLEWYESTNGTAPAAAELIAANLKGSFEPDQQYPLVSSQ